ncbi:hypothetical protein LXL04_007685 [Taraxacum kok-saghyz]
MVSKNFHASAENDKDNSKNNQAKGESNNEFISCQTKVSENLRVQVANWKWEEATNLMEDEGFKEDSTDTTVSKKSSTLDIPPPFAASYPHLHQRPIALLLNWAVTSDKAVCHSTQRTRVQTLPEEITTTSSATQFPIKGFLLLWTRFEPDTIPAETPGRGKLECASDQLNWTSLARMLK